MPEYRAILSYNRRHRVTMTFEAETNAAARAKRAEVEAWANRVLSRDADAAEVADAYLVLDRLNDGTFDEELDAFELQDAG